MTGIRWLDDLRWGKVLEASCSQDVEDVVLSFTALPEIDGD